MSDDRTVCAVCAWRAACQKKFSMKAGQKCVDFVKDVTIKEVNDDENGPKKEPPSSSQNS